MSSVRTFGVLTVLALFLLAGCTGQAPQTIASSSNVFSEDGQQYIQTTAYLNDPAELYASNVPGFNGIRLADGQYANATGKVTILLTQTKQECVYPLVPQTGYVGGFFGIGAIRVTEFVPQNSEFNLQYDVSVNGVKVASQSPFRISEFPINLPYNAKLGQTPVMKIKGLDAGRGAAECPAAADFVIIRVEDTSEARLGGLVGQVSIRDKVQYFANKNNLNSVPLPRVNMDITGFNANAPTYTYVNAKLGSAYVSVKVPLGAFNIVTYRPAAAGRAQQVGQCVIQDAQQSQQTNLEFTYKNIGETSVFDYTIESGKYVYVSGSRASGQQVAFGDSRTVQLRVTPNNDAKGSQLLPISVCGESGICTTVPCLGNVLEGGTPNPLPLPTPVPGMILPATQCKFYEKAVTQTVGQSSFLFFTWGGAQSGKCMFDFSLVGGALAAFGFLIVVLGLVMIGKGNDEVGKYVAILGALILVAGLAMVFLGFLIENSAELLWAGVGLGIVAVILVIFLGPAILKR